MAVGAEYVPNHLIILESEINRHRDEINSTAQPKTAFNEINSSSREFHSNVDMERLYWHTHGSMLWHSHSVDG